MKVISRDPQFLKPDWLVGKSFRCTRCDKDYVFERQDIEQLRPVLNGYRSNQEDECPPMEVSCHGRVVDFQCCGCGRPVRLQYYDYYNRNW